MKQLIVNADDFGYTAEVNAGIIRGFREGIVTSTTIMANGHAFEDAIERARENPQLGVGCHVVLVGGKCVAPAEQVASLVDSDARLPVSLAALLTKLSRGSARLEDIEREVRAQIERVIGAGVPVTHLDSHKHTHSHPRVMEAVAHVAGELGIRRIRKPFEDVESVFRPVFGAGLGAWKQRAIAVGARINASRFHKLANLQGMRMPDRFLGVAATGRLNRRVLLSMIGLMREGTTELMCHPGQYDDDLELSPTRLKRERERELDGLTDPAVCAAVHERGVRLIDFRGLD